jgi:hypothetical protein
MTRKKKPAPTTGAPAIPAPLPGKPVVSIDQIRGALSTTRNLSMSVTSTALECLLYVGEALKLTPEQVAMAADLTDDRDDEAQRVLIRKLVVLHAWASEVHRGTERAVVDLYEHDEVAKSRVLEWRKK